MKHSFPHICNRADEKNFKTKKKQYFISKCLSAMTVDQKFTPTLKLKFQPVLGLSHTLYSSWV